MKELSPYFIRRTTAPSPPRPLLLTDRVGEERSEPEFRDFWRVLKKRQRFIALFFFTVVVTVGAGTFLMTRIYTSETTLLIEEKGPQVVDIKQVLSETIGGTDKHD